jgi:hypothetical protein
MNRSVSVIILGVILVSLLASCGRSAPGPDQMSDADGSTSAIFQSGKYPSNAYNGAETAGISSGSPYTAASGSLWVGHNNAPAAGVERGIIKFDITNILPPGAKVTRCYLTLHCNTINCPDGAPVIQAYDALNSWDASGTSWMSRTASALWDTAGGIYSAGPVSESITVGTAGDYNLKLNNSEVQNWVDGKGNNGVFLVAVSETAGTSEAVFSPASALFPDVSPMLKIFYKFTD